jgi:hypothetical protein
MTSKKPRYRKIDVSMWNDEKFHSLSPNAKLAFIFLITHPQMTSLGAMRASVEGLSAELGVPAEAFREVFAKGLAEAYSEGCCVYVKNFIFYQTPQSPNVVLAWAGALELIPECHLKTLAIQDAKALTEGLGEAFRDAFGKAILNKEKGERRKKTCHVVKGGSKNGELDEITRLFPGGTT